jgi:SAM-dependent methyltransferase
MDAQKLLVDWSTEKTKLSFLETSVDRRRRILKRAIDKSSNQIGSEPRSSASDNGFAQIQMLYNNEPIGCIILENLAAAKWRLNLEVERDHSNSSFVLNSLIRVALLAAHRKTPSSQVTVEFDPREISDNLNLSIVENLEAFGFKSEFGKLVHQVNSSSSSELQELKRFLHDYVKAAPFEGRGFLIDATKLPAAAMAALNNEYHEVAWGVTNWARHGSICRDELEIIERYTSGGRGLEVGAGSGRVTAHLFSRFDKLTATDIIPSALEQIASLVTSDVQCEVEIQVDDILESRLESAAYDVVMFWENGLGAFLNPAERLKAVSSMVRVLKPGGRMILGVRNLISRPVDQLMVAAQTDLVMGIYHTFTLEEVEGMMPGSMILRASHVGDPRPAGGHQLFLIFEKQ